MYLSQKNMTDGEPRPRGLAVGIANRRGGVDS
jgi:hypothetical protein